MKFEIDKKLAADAKMIGAQALKALVFTSLLLAAGGPWQRKLVSAILVKRCVAFLTMSTAC